MSSNNKVNKSNISLIFRFLKSLGLPASKKGISPYDLCTKALETKFGIHKAEHVSNKTHIKDNLYIINQQASRIPVKKKKTTQIKQSSPTNNVRQPTEESVKSYITNYSKVNPASDDFLSSFEWKAVRMMALKKYGPVCQCCGASPKTGAVMHVDHIKPRKIFPNLALEIDNLQILCSDCNEGKGNWSMDDWREHEDPPELIRLVREIGAS